MHLHNIFSHQAQKNLTEDGKIKSSSEIYLFSDWKDKKPVKNITPKIKRQGKRQQHINFNRIIINKYLNQFHLVNML